MVDNHPMVLKYVSGLLEKNGYQVETAEDGLFAIDALESFSPDFIFVDLVMPNIDGPTFCRIIRKDARFAETPIFILTATAAEARCLPESIGADLCIAKGPFPEMGENILRALASWKTSDRPDESDRVLGLDKIYPRGITKELLDVKKHFETLLKSISDGIVEINDEGRILYINPAASDFLSTPSEQLIGRNLLGLFGKTAREKVAGVLESGGTLRNGQCVVHRNRHLSVKAIGMDSDRSNRLVVINDVTEYERTRSALVKANDALSVLSRTDGLTGIANRRWFDDRLLREWRRMRREGNPLSLLLCDIDYFKDFNDRYGHPAGDQCLQAVSRALAEQSKRPGDLAARYGGDEFALILPDTAKAGAVHLANVLQKEIEELDFSIMAGEKKIPLSLSIGIASARPGGGNTPENLLSLADNALYDAKKAGRNQMVHRELGTGRTSPKQQCERNPGRQTNPGTG